MKVAVVAPRYTEVGGMQNYVRSVVSMLRDHPDFEVVVVTTRPGLRRTVETYDGVQVVRLGTWFTLSNTPVNPLWWWHLRRLFRRAGVQLINAHSPVPFLADLAVLAAGGRPVVLTYHAGSLVKGVGGVVDVLLRAYERWVLPAIFARCARLVAVSPVAMTQRLAGAPVIAPGVDTGRFATADVGRTRSIAFVGRIERSSRWKGLQVLIDAVPAIARQVPDVVLDVIGGGDDLPAMKARADELGVGARVRWHGFVAHDDLPAVLQRAGVTVLPSLTEAESFGMALVEAMAAGCPVVGSAVGGIPYVIDDGVNGVLVPPGESAALAAAVSGVLTDPARAARLGAAGRCAAETVWDVSHQREHTLAELRAAAQAGVPVR